MKIPKTVKVGGAVYAVVLQDNLRDPDNESGLVHGKCDLLRRIIFLNQDNSDNVQETTLLHEPALVVGVAHGKCDLLRRIIFLNQDNSDNVQETTLLHELIHALTEIYGITPMTEADVDRLANGLHAVIRQNPGLFTDEGRGR